MRYRIDEMKIDNSWIVILRKFISRIRRTSSANDCISNLSSSNLYNKPLSLDHTLASILYWMGDCYYK